MATWDRVLSSFVNMCCLLYTPHHPCLMSLVIAYFLFSIEQGELVIYAFFVTIHAYILFMTHIYVMLVVIIMIYAFFKCLVLCLAALFGWTSLYGYFG